MFKHHIWAKVAKTALIAASLMVSVQTVSVQADTVHTAKEGDTFYLLAKKYGVNLSEMLSANPKINPTNIYPGLRITVPGKTSTLTAKASTDPKIINGGKAAAVPALKVFADTKVVKAWGKSFNYSRTVKVMATAYSSAACENGWGAVDYFGQPLELGTIAVDPKVIPMGTKVLVTGHSHAGLPKQAFVATASDQGSAIKGDQIDIFIPGSRQFASSFGRQDVKLYVLN